MVRKVVLFFFVNYFLERCQIWFCTSISLFFFFFNSWVVVKQSNPVLDALPQKLFHQSFIEQICLPPLSFKGFLFSPRHSLCCHCKYIRLIGPSAFLCVSSTHFLLPHRVSQNHPFLFSFHFFPSLDHWLPEDICFESDIANFSQICFLPFPLASLSRFLLDSQQKYPL